MPYVKIIEGVVIQKQPDEEDGFVYAPDIVVCGMIYNGSGFVLPEPDIESEIKKFEIAIQAHLDGSAREMGYDSIHTAVTYADEDSVEKFQQEGQALRSWRSLVWKYAYDQLSLVTSGQRSKPSIQDFIEELPALITP